MTADDSSDKAQYPQAKPGEPGATPPRRHTPPAERPSARLSPTDRLIVHALHPDEDHDIAPVGDISLDGPISTLQTREVDPPSSRRFRPGRLRQPAHPAASDALVPKQPAADATPRRSDRHYGMPVGERNATTEASLPVAAGRSSHQLRSMSERVSNRSSASLPVSSFDSGSPIDLRDPRTHAVVWLGFGLLGGLGGQLAAWWFFHASDTLAGAMMFSLAILAGRIHPLFQRNAKEIWTRSLSPGRANWLLARDILVLFVGLLLGYILLPIVLGMERYSSTFSSIQNMVDIRRMHLLDFDHGNWLAILINNSRVLLVFFLVGLIFRYIGTLIVIVFNAATWGVVLAAALAGTFIHSAVWWQLPLITLALAPHIIIETGAYVLAAMAGIFLSRGAVRYRWHSSRFRSVGEAVLHLMKWAMIAVVLGSLIEAWWATFWIQFIFRHEMATGGAPW